MSNRTAEVRLRHAGRVRRAQVHWPPRAEGSTSPALVVFYGPGAVGDELAGALGTVVLVAAADDLDDLGAAVATLEWAADHAGEFCADPAQLVVAGAGAGVTVASAVARLARQHGWPRVADRPLVGADLDAALDAGRRS